MERKHYGLLARVVMPLVVMVATVLLFFVFMPADAGALFYTNLVYSVVLEAVFFGWLGSLWGRASLPRALAAVFGVYAAFYVVAGFIVMLAYSVVGAAFLPLKFYYAAIVIITLLWVVVASLTAGAGVVEADAADRQADSRAAWQYHVAQLASLASRYDDLARARGLRFEMRSNDSSPLDKLRRAVQSMPPSAFSGQVLPQRLKELAEDLNRLADDLEAAADGDDVSQQGRKLERFVADACRDLDNIRLLARR